MSRHPQCLADTFHGDTPLRAVNTIDTHIGRRIKGAREKLGLAVADLAYEIGVSIARMQAFERGHIRVAAGQLFQLSKSLEVEMAYFFKGL